MAKPILLVADAEQKIFDLPGYQACGQAGKEVSVLSADDLIPLPPGSDMFFLPDRYPVAFNMQDRCYEELKDLSAVAAFVPPGHTHLLTAAFTEKPGANILPLFSYTPVAWWKGAFHVPVIRIDRRTKHQIHELNHAELTRKIRVLKNSSNRLIKHIENCALVNHCPNAINFFLGKHEAPLPVSPNCNASCMGCISFQPKDSCAATQPRLKFKPTASEIAEIALLHIKRAKDPIVSFGQGCEGEPLLAVKVIYDAIKIIRAQTRRGTIHMNTNASLTGALESLFEAGLDSIRVSLNSVQPQYYERYYLPRGYGFSDVCRSIDLARKQGKFVALNYLTMPGFTDRADEFTHLVRFISRHKVDMIQWRNLNYDPRRYFAKLGIRPDSKLLGLRTVIARLRKAFPDLRHGYFNVFK